MNKKRLNILIVCRDFDPIISPRSFRATELAKEFARQGQNINVLTLGRKDRYVDFKRENPDIKILMLPELKYPEINSSGRKFNRLALSALRRLLILLFEYPNIELKFKITRYLQKVSGYDLLISIAAPHAVHWGVASARKHNHKIATVWVADCGDPYMGDTNDSFRKPFYFKYLEKKFCRKADYITIPRIEMKINYYPEFHYKILQIPQGINFEEYKTAEYKRNNVPTFAFAGNFIRTTRNPARLLEYLSSLKIDFKFKIYSTNHELVLPYADSLGGKLELHYFIPRKELIYELSKMDFLINIAFDPVRQSPSKLIDYSLSGRPILMLSSDDVDSIAINEFLSGNYEKQYRVNDLDNFNIKKVAQKFIDLCVTD